MIRFEECWMDEDGEIRFQHYEKPMASKLVLSAGSALPAQQKRNIHTNECVRRLRNCDPSMSWGERKEFLQNYVIRMYHAGYSESFRQDIIKQAIARYEGMLKADGDGHHPLYRPRDWKEQERREQRGRKKKDWFSKGGYDTVIMVNPTPGGELAKQLQEVLNKNPGPVKIKVQEQGGIQVKKKLQKSNPNKT